MWERQKTKMRMGKNDALMIHPSHKLPKVPLAFHLHLVLNE